MRSNPNLIESRVAAIPTDRLPAEIAFAKAALDEDDAATVYWLAALYARFEAEVAAEA